VELVQTDRLTKVSSPTVIKDPSPPGISPTVHTVNPTGKTKVPMNRTAITGRLNKQAINGRLSTVCGDRCNAKIASEYMTLIMFCFLGK
jgi:hypothetical protein